MAAKSRQTSDTIRLVLKVLLTLGFFRIVIMTVINWMDQDTSISILSGSRIPLPSMTFCSYPITYLDTANMTLVSFLESDEESLDVKMIRTSVYSEVNSTFHMTNNAENPKKPLDVYSNMTSVSVTNGSLTKCVTFEPTRQKFLGSKAGVVSKQT